jgi:cation diffusion facilitator family transporter
MPRTAAGSSARRGIRAAQAGMLVNAALAAVKLVAGILGHTYALIADAVESSADIFSSVIVWRALDIAEREPDEKYPYGYGKAEPLGTAAVAMMLLLAAAGIAIQAVREILTPHQTPAPWTLGVLIAVMVVKFVLSSRVSQIGNAIDSTAVRADAWHHLSDAITSGAAFIGIAIAVLAGPGWESADDWAALAATLVIGYNGVSMLRAAAHDLMDRTSGDALLNSIRAAALEVPGVLAVEKVAARKAGLGHRVTIHIQADPSTSLHDAHALGGRAKARIREVLPAIDSVLVHMEPYEPGQ